MFAIVAANVAALHFTVAVAPLQCSGCSGSAATLQNNAAQLCL